MDDAKINAGSLRKPKGLDPYEEIVIIDFLEEHWDAWVDHCQRNEISPEKIFVKLSGESEGNKN
jgi:hypothetical protein